MKRNGEGVVRTEVGNGGGSPVVDGPSNDGDDMENGTEPPPTVVRSKRTKGSATTAADEKERGGTEGTNDDRDMTSEEITSALRELGIPVWLFGETDDDQRNGRLREARESQKAELAGMSEMDDFRLGRGHGIRNTFLGGKKGKKDEDRQSTRVAADAAKATNNIAGGGERSIVNRVPMDIRNITDTDPDTSDPHKTIHRFFKFLLRHWEEDLALRPDSARRTAAGRNETKTLKQCKDYIRPLFKLCKTRRLEETIMGRILSIVNFCEEGEFVNAHDAYIDVAIGRAAWPIGVTMVAHVMNSELQRKYLTSVKRLMTYCQKKRVDVA